MIHRVPLGQAQSGVAPLRLVRRVEGPLHRIRLHRHLQPAASGTAGRDELSALYLHVAGLIGSAEPILVLILGVQIHPQRIGASNLHAAVSH